jgi:uncharacterized protein
MRIKLSDILDEGLELRYEETPQELDLVYPDVAFEGGVLVDVRLTRVGETITTHGALQATVSQECGRCLKPFTRPVRLGFQTDFHPSPAESKGAGEHHRLSFEELDLHFYTGRILDLGEFVREQILLALPMVPLCRADCRGLCPVCGQDLNIKPCGCGDTFPRTGPNDREK